MGTVVWGHMFVVVEYMTTIYETLDPILSTQERKEKAGVGVGLRAKTSNPKPKAEGSEQRVDLEGTLMALTCMWS